MTVNVNLPTQPAAGHGPVVELKSTGLAYVIWALAGIFGAHRFYLGRPHGVTMLILSVVGVLTSVLLVGLIPLAIVAIWALVDAVAIPNWVAESRAAALAPVPRVSLPKSPATTHAPALPRPPARPRPGDLRTELLRAAVAKDGVLTVTEGVLVTGKTFKEVETCLQGMVDSGYVDVDNAPGSGVIRYVFTELRK